MKPSAHLTSFCYDCPQCRKQVWLTDAGVGRDNTCYNCGTTFYADRVKMVLAGEATILPPQVQSPKPEPKREDKPNILQRPNSFAKARVIDLLVNYGYSSYEIEDAFDKVTRDKVQCNSEDDYVREVLKLL